MRACRLPSAAAGEGRLATATASFSLQFSSFSTSRRLSAHRACRPIISLSSSVQSARYRSRRALPFALLLSSFSASLCSSFSASPFALLAQRVIRLFRLMSLALFGVFLPCPYLTPTVSPCAVISPPDISPAGSPVSSLMFYLHQDLTSHLTGRYVRPGGL